MLIDWFTVGAQLLNFLILVWLLKRFLYKPIINAVDTREARIKEERDDADAIKTAAETERDDLQKKSEAFKQKHATLLKKAKGELAAERKSLMAEAQGDADALTAKRAKSFKTEARALDKSITDRVRDEVFAIARKMLKDLADVSLEGRICDAFIDRITAFNDQPDAALSKAIRAASDPIPLRSAFDMSKAQHEAIQSALHKTFSTDAKLTFDTDPELIGGIELTVGGQKLAWSISDYMTSLKTGVDKALAAHEHTKASPEVDAKADAKTGAKANPKPKPKSDKTQEKTGA